MAPRALRSSYETAGRKATHTRTNDPYNRESEVCHFAGVRQTVYDCPIRSRDTVKVVRSCLRKERRPPRVDCLQSGLSAQIIFVADLSSSSPLRSACGR